METLKDTIIPDINMNPALGLAIKRSWRLNKTPSAAPKALKSGNMIFVKHYEAQTVQDWDKNPTILIFNVSTSYILGFNINWMNRHQRIKIINIIYREMKVHKKMDRHKRLRLFNKLKKIDFFRNAIRIYHRSEISKSLIYNLNMGEFFEAVTHNLIKT